MRFCYLRGVKEVSVSNYAILLCPIPVYFRLTQLTGKVGLKMNQIILTTIKTE